MGPYQVSLKGEGEVTKEKPDTDPGPLSADVSPSPNTMIDILPFRIGVALKYGPYDVEVSEYDREHRGA